MNLGGTAEALLLSYKITVGQGLFLLKYFKIISMKGRKNMKQEIPYKIYLEEQ